MPETFIFNLGSEHILPVTVHRAAAVPRAQRRSSHRKNRQYTNHFCRCKSKTRRFCDTLDHSRFPCLTGNLLTEKGVTSIGDQHPVGSRVEEDGLRISRELSQANHRRSSIENHFETNFSFNNERSHTIIIIMVYLNLEQID